MQRINEVKLSRFFFLSTYWWAPVCVHTKCPKWIFTYRNITNKMNCHVPSSFICIWDLHMHLSMLYCCHKFCATTSKSLCFSYALPQSSTLIPLFTLKWKRGWKKQQQPLLPVKLLVPPLTALTGESKAIQMTRRQIVCDTSKGLEKLETEQRNLLIHLRRERGRKKHKADKHAPHGQHKHPETPALLSASPQTQTQTRPPRLHVQWLHHSRSRAQRG